MFEIVHHGAVDGVTGSCHQLRLATGESLLVDCGLFQGAESLDRESGHEDFARKQIDFIRRYCRHRKMLMLSMSKPWRICAARGGRRL